MSADTKRKLGGYLWETMTQPGPPKPLWWGAYLPKLTPADVGAIWSERRRRSRA